jgi:hypothetical protein
MNNVWNGFKFIKYNIITEERNPNTFIYHLLNLDVVGIFGMEEVMLI